MRERPETFRSSGSLVFGAITVAVALTLAVLAAVHPRAGAPAWLSAALVLFALVVYVASMRPAVVLGDAELVLRNMLSSVHVPWSLVGEVRVRQFLTVEAGDRTFDCAAVGRSRRQIHRDARRLAETPVVNPAELSYGRFVETKIRNRAEEARRRPETPDHQVRVVRAWPEIVGLTAGAVTLVVLVLV